MAKLMFMGVMPDEEPRCRIYDATGQKPAVDHRLVFLRTCAGPGAIDCPAYDGWVEALQARGWLPKRPELERNPDGPGSIGRWFLTDAGREGLAMVELEVERGS